jgi:ankyrin repeat protein
MSVLPARPDIEQLREQAKELLRAARAGDAVAADRIRAVSVRPSTLAAAQLAVAREYGFASWARLKTEVQARTRDLARRSDAFLEASVRDWTGRAARMLSDTPQIAGYDVRTALVLGDAARVGEQIARDPGWATRPDPRTGWTALHVVCASRWHQLDPARAPGLLAVARLLLDAGADPGAQVARRPAGSGCWTPLRCAVAGAANAPVTRLLLERGAVPQDHDVYLACFGGDDLACLRLLLEHMPNLAEGTALAAPISTGDTEAVRLLLEAGADPRRAAPADLYGSQHADDPPWPTLYAAVRSHCPAELVELLLERGADPSAPGPDGRSPHRLATGGGESEVAALLRRHGARDDAGAAERFLSACLRADRADARRQLSLDGGLLDRLSGAERGALVRAAETGATAAVELMLDLGFPVETRRGEDGATALHAASHSGGASTVRLLVERGADLEARDTTWDSTPIVWAMVGSGERPTLAADPDWVTTVRTLIEAGAATHDLTLSSDDPKPSSPQVAQLLRAYGVGERHQDPAQ